MTSILGKNTQARVAQMSRSTQETKIEMQIDLDGEGKCKFDTPIPFFEHMLSHIAKQGMVDMHLQLEGDIGIDCHHSVEDTAIVLGKLLYQALGDKFGISRYGHFTLPMDETLVTVALDFSGRPSFIYRGSNTIKKGKFGIYDAELSLEFLQKLAIHSAMNLHVHVHYGDNRHHIHEAVFKALGRSLYMAVNRNDPRRSKSIPSTKGMLE